MDKIDIKSLYINELEALCQQCEEKKFRAEQIFGWFHEKLISSMDHMTNLSKSFRQELEQLCYVAQVEEVDRLVSTIDGTTKFLFRLLDGHVIESVLMKYKHGNSVCISSQVGCKMGCGFCASTLNGFARNLTASEMLEQVYAIQKVTGERVSNVVVMGTGEPLDNYENLIRFLRLITHEQGLHISARNITVSTCGLVDKIEKLADENIPITLAISLHAPNDYIRQQMMPIAYTHSIRDILNVCNYYLKQTNRRITIEYSLVSGVNDSEDNGKELVKVIKKLHCHVNLIPINPIDEYKIHKPNKENIKKFQNILEKNRINVTIRREMGQDINAACGQLRKSYMDKI